MVEFFSIGNVLVHIPIGKGGYALSYIEALGTLCGLTCIYLASIEKTLNYLFGLLNVTLFAIIFFQINLYASLLLQIFFFLANVYGWYVWTRHRPGSQEATLKIRWLTRAKTIMWFSLCVIAILLLTFFIDPVFIALTRFALHLLHFFGFDIAMPVITPDAYPFWDATMLVLSMAAQILMTRKYVENWGLWFVINVISLVIFVKQGIYAMAIEYAILLLIAANGIRVWVASAKENDSVPPTKSHV